MYLFNIVTFFNDVRNRFHFGTFELRMEMTLELCFVLVSHVNVFFITSQLRYLFVPCSTFIDDVRSTFYFGTFELRPEITLQNGHFLVTFIFSQKMTKKLRNYYVICQLRWILIVALIFQNWNYQAELAPEMCF